MQNWDLAWRHFEAAERLAEGKPGLRWIRYALLDASGRHEPLRQQLLAEARRLAAGTSDELILAQRLVRQAAGR